MGVFFLGMQIETRLSRGKREPGTSTKQQQRHSNDNILEKYEEVIAAF